MGESNYRLESSDERAPLRQCAVTRIHRPTSDLIRFVLDPSDKVVPDLKCKLPGRGVWVTAARDCVEEAVSRRVFARAFKTSVNADDDLAELVADLLRREAMQRLSLANKAGDIVCGFAKVETAISGADFAYLIHAADAAADGCRKLDSRLNAVCRDVGKQAVVINCFSSEQLSLALGRSNVVHAAVKQGGAATNFLMAALRFQRYAAGREAYAAA